MHALLHNTMQTHNSKQASSSNVQPWCLADARISDSALPVQYSALPLISVSTYSASLLISDSTFPLQDSVLPLISDSTFPFQDSDLPLISHCRFKTARCRLSLTAFVCFVFLCLRVYMTAICVCCFDCCVFMIRFLWFRLCVFDFVFVLTAACN